MVVMNPEELRESLEDFEELFLRPAIEELAEAIIESDSATKH